MNKTDIIKELIKDTKLSIKAFSEKADVPYTTLRSMLERGIENASVNNVIKICNALDITVDSLYDTQIYNDELLKDEQRLLTCFNKLNDLGKREASKRVFELSELPRYTLNHDVSADFTYEENLGMAAHNDFATEVEQQKLMKEDLDEL